MGKTREEYQLAIDSLNLQPIMAKLEYEGVRKDVIEELEVIYRGFLLLHALHPGTIMVPTQELDEFWHHHILDTAKYAEDCEAVFGFFLHHFPYFGMRNEDDAVDLQEKFRRTSELFEQDLGRPYRLTGQTIAVCNGGVCGYINSWRPEYVYSV